VQIGIGFGQGMVRKKDVKNEKIKFEHAKFTYGKILKCEKRELK